MHLKMLFSGIFFFVSKVAFNIPLITAKYDNIPVGASTCFSDFKNIKDAEFSDAFIQSFIYKILSLKRIKSSLIKKEVKQSSNGICKFVNGVEII